MSKRLVYVLLPVFIALAALFALFGITGIARGEDSTFDHTFTFNSSQEGFIGQGRCDVWYFPHLYSPYIGYDNTKALYCYPRSSSGHGNWYITGDELRTQLGYPSTATLTIENVSVQVFHNNGTEAKELGVRLYYDDTTWYQKQFENILLVPGDNRTLTGTKEIAKGSGSAIMLYSDHMGYGGSTFLWFDDLRITGYEGDPPVTDPDDESDPSYGSHCTFTETVGITETVEYSRPANLIENYSFEDGGAGPANWSYGGVPWTFYADGYSGLAHSGDDSIVGDSYELTGDPWPFALNQYLTLHSGGTYRVGNHGRAVCDYGDESTCEAETVTASYSGLSSVTFTPALSDCILIETSYYNCPYQVVSDTLTTGGGGGVFQLSLSNAGGGTIYADDVFLYPIDESGDLLCEPEYYAPYDAVEDGGEDPETPGTPDPPVPPPIPGGGGPGPDQGPVLACYTCVKPDGFGITKLGNWIIYLACVFWNIFSCSVRIWLLNIVNVLQGVWGSIVSFILWLPETIWAAILWLWDLWASWLSWLVSLYTSFVAWLSSLPALFTNWLLSSDFVQYIWAVVSFIGLVWDALVAFVQGIIDFVGDLVDGIAYLLTLFISIIQAVVTAWQAEGYQLDFLPGYGDPDPEASVQLSGQAGPTIEKIYWIIVTGLSSFDYVSTSFGFQYIQIILIGILSLGLILWTLNKWRDILPI